MTEGRLRDTIARKLVASRAIAMEDLRTLDVAMSDPEHVPPRTDIIGRGDRTHNVHVVLDGIACRYKIVADGGRSIMALLVPGDFCDLHIAILGRMDHGIAALTGCMVATLPPETIDRILANPRMARALWWATLVDEAILREWLVSMGRRRADRRCAHLFCELYLRLRTVGLAEGDSMSLPLTQEQLADTLGITAVHTQRVLQELRRQGLIMIQGQTITIPDFATLSDFAEFEPDYLHLDGRTVGIFG